MIRVSGRDALAIGDRVFQSAGGKKLSQMKGYTAAYGRIRSNGEDIDEAVAWCSGRLTAIPARTWWNFPVTGGCI